MDDLNTEKNTGNEPDKPSYTPASRKTRVIAWIGVIAMVVLVILYSYSIANGSFLNW